MAVLGCGHVWLLIPVGMGHAPRISYDRTAAVSDYIPV